VEVERAPTGREVVAAPATWEEEGGAVLVVPVVAEGLVTERRLVLEKKPRIRRVSTSSTSERTSPLRRRTATVERLPARLGAGLESNERHDGAGDPT
jgi:stress response protein YsnF